MDLNKLRTFLPGRETGTIETIDMHTGGEPLRVVTGGLPPVEGNTILEKRRYFRENYDNIRRTLMFEPRGHADMYGAIITEPVAEGADFGTFFIHNEGYSTMCGHAIIALVKLALDSGFIDRKGDTPLVEIDAPPGRISAVARRNKGIVESVSFRNVPSFVLYQDSIVDVPGIGRIEFDLAFGGAFYAFCEASPLGLNLDSSDYNKLIDYGRRIKNAIIENYNIVHPYEADLGFLYGTIFIGAPYCHSNWSRNVCVFAEGEVDRSPTGSGVSARAALHFSKKELHINEKVTIESILGTTMDVEIVDTVEYGNHKAVIPQVTGTSYYTGKNSFWIDKSDPLAEGFIFR
jgi:trans-L-3-hydroxyproline dehydratase